jgi:glutamyl-tRNA synthetase/glutamyl-Q tRNA(Asp) synthetase
MLTRFAPAPTGFLHLGHVANAICVWGLARARNGHVLLRIEDHDRQRSRPEYERALLDDLEWLGFEPDQFSIACFRAGRCEGRQSDRLTVYESVARDLIGRGLIYGCTCSREDIAQTSESTSKGERPYPGTCRGRGVSLDGDVAWRVQVGEATEAFDDLWCGRQVQQPAAQCGDFVVRDRLGQWTYQFVAAVDDHLQGVDVVVRGRDLLASTGRQIWLARTIGRASPAQFAHHPLIMRTPVQKLSKSARDTGVRDLRQQGWSPEDVKREAARRIGLDPYLALSAIFSNPTPFQR